MFNISSPIYNSINQVEEWRLASSPRLTWKTLRLWSRAERSSPLQIEPQNPDERLLELRIGECIAQWIEHGVHVAQPVTQAVYMFIYARIPDRLVITEAFYEDQDMVGCPTEDEGAQDDADCFQRLSSPVFRSAPFRL